jgi:hypothetical protein
MQFFLQLASQIYSQRCEIDKYGSSLDFPSEFFTNQTVFTNLHVPKAELRCKMQKKIASCNRALIHVHDSYMSFRGFICMEYMIWVI